MYAAQQTNPGYGGDFGRPFTSVPQEAIERQLEIPAGLERLERQVAGLDELVTLLDDRLTGRVARSQIPSSDNKTGTLKTATQCGVGGHLDALGDYVQDLRDRLQSLVERLEV